MTALEQYMIPCLTKTLFGVNCFGCGFQRSLLLLLKGQLIEAFWMYPGIYPMIVFGILILLSKFYDSRYIQKGIHIFGILSIIVIIINYIVKLLIL